MARKTAVAALSIALLGAATSVSLGQAPKQGEAQVPKAGAGGGAPLAVPDARQLGILVQTAMVAASQANLTGNYTVLHALSAPSFKEANPPEKLAQTFSAWREKKVDLTPIVIYTPILTHHPAINEKNMLRITGYYPTEPLRVHFDLVFQPVAGQWRIFGIAINALPAQAAPPAQQPAAAQPAPAQPPPDKKKPAAPAKPPPPAKQ